MNPRRPVDPTDRNGTVINLERGSIGNTHATVAVPHCFDSCFSRIWQMSFTHHAVTNVGMAIHPGRIGNIHMPHT